MNNTALITGASGGIGHELSRIFAENGYDLVLVARNAEELDSIKEELEGTYGIKAHVIIKDLSEKDAALSVYEEIMGREHEIRILVNNAGFGDYSPYYESNWNKQYEMIQVNIVSLMQLTRLFLPHMIENGEGRILNIASIAAFEPGPYMSAYYASKAFVLSFSEALSAELKGTGVTVTASCPGPTRTGFDSAAGEGAVKMFSSIKTSSPEDVARFSYRSLMKGKVVAVPGLTNKFLVSIQRILPRSTVRSFVSRIQREKD